MGGFERVYCDENSTFLKYAQKNDQLTIILIGRPYHADMLINHKIPEMITTLGANVITEDEIPIKQNQDLSSLKILSQWTFPNRLFTN